MSDECLRVAVRVRPLIPSEVERGCETCINVIPGEQQIQMNGTEKAFTYNFVFGSDVQQDHVYETSVKDMIQKIFKGYNVTILAYGQTGSGKTYSMGTNYSPTAPTPSGIIPRAVEEIFSTISTLTPQNWVFKVTVSFMELYKEQLFDLLVVSSSSSPRESVDIREDNGTIKISNLTETQVKSPEEVLHCLTVGSQGRATGATAMNSQSSRSHAIFTITVSQQQKDDPNTATTSKFHLVDLAGSERSKKTQATGDRFKEGVSINKGLLALGNVISNLGDNSAHIGYRDSKLTRLLQDSLGGNSITLMIACVSPADYNFDETLSTLRYADRAKKIKNKPIVNQDPRAAEINRLNAMVKELKLSLLEKPGGACPPEHTELSEKNRLLQKKLRELSEQLNTNLIEFVGMHERAELAEQSREKLREEIVKLSEDIQSALDEKNPETIYTKLQNIQEKLIKIQNFQKDSESEMIHQISLEKSLPMKEQISEADNSLNESSLDEEHAEHTLLQAARNKEVTTLTRELAFKEQLVAKLLTNNSLLEHDKELHDMENEIKTLQSEKEQLLRTLEDVQTNNTSAKIAESRRKKVKELEKKITELSKKCIEQGRILKSKEKTDLQVKNLNQEILQMKQTRVKLIRDMRKEAEKFQQYKCLREKEVYKLKDQDRKRKNQMERLKVLHNKQQNVMKRKMEEAQAVNKKLKETLALQKKIRGSREEKGKRSKDFIQRLVNHEVMVIQETVNARYALEAQMKYRAQVAESLTKLRARHDENPSDYLKREISDLEEYLDLCTTKISQMQRDLMTSDFENMVKSRLENIHTIAEAKLVAQNLFEVFEGMFKQHKVDEGELQEKYDELMGNYDAAKMEARQMELRQNQNFVGVEAYRETLEELERYKGMYKELEESRTSTGSKKGPRKTRPSVVENLILEARENVDDESFNESFNDDPDKDPDWQRTPLFKRTRSSVLAGKGEAKGRKRASVEEGKCRCMSKCQNIKCGCFKAGSGCGDNCGCHPDRCENRGNQNENINKYFNEEEEQTVGRVKKIRTE